MSMIQPRTPVPANQPGQQDDATYAAARLKRAQTLKDPWLSMFEECYEYAMPGKESVFLTAPGQRRTNFIYDETAVVGVQEFASRLQSGLVPQWSRWSQFEPGSSVDAKEKAEVQAALEDVTDFVFSVINGSNFAQEVSESFLDLAVGTGCLHVDEGDDPNHPIRFTAIPLAQYSIDVGPDDSVDFIARRRQLRRSQLKIRYPKARLDEDDGNNTDEDDRPIDLAEIVFRDWNKPTETWVFLVMCTHDNDIILREEFEGIGANPFLVFRWAKVAGEAWGRGPLLNALPAVKTCNLTVELILENAEMAITGLYTIDDDGIVNVDTIQLLPGTVIPIPAGSKLTGLPQPGSFDVAQLVLQDMRANIKKALYNEMLGNPDKTPLSATEVSARMADLSRQIGAAFGRLQTELVEPVLRRVVYLLRKQGLIKLPAVNGRTIAIRPTSPLSQAQKHQDVTTVAGYVQSIGQMFGPEMTNVLVKSEDVADWMADNLGVPKRLLRSADERKKIVQMGMAAMQGQAPAGGAPGPGAPPNGAAPPPPG